MLEHIGSDYADLHTDLRDGLNSAWQQFTLAFCGGQDTGGNYYRIDQSNPVSPVVIMGSRTRYLRQYFSFIRQDALRIGAVSGESRLDPGVQEQQRQDRRRDPGWVPRRCTSGTASGPTARFTTSTDTSPPPRRGGRRGWITAAMPASGVMTIFAR
jgi:hypothetical protein